jgi:hypothetical protein
LELVNIMSKVKTMLLAAALAMVGTAAQAQYRDNDWCFYNGKVYSDGAQNPAGQVCDGSDGTWK